MNCPEMTDTLHGYLDKELDPVRSQEVEQHLMECPDCQRRYAQQQSLRRAMANQPALHFETPRGLQRRVRTAVREAARAEAPRVRWSWDWNWLRPRALAPIAVAALALLLALPWMLQPSAQSRLVSELVSANVRSLMAAHLTDVTSTDQHTVKPWFNGKITFSPPTPDFAAQGFPLIGGRLDVLEEQPAAVLVYQRRKHFINLFIRPTAQSGESNPKFLAQRGYHLAHWVQGGMDYWAVSDVGQADLQEFVQLAQAGLEK